MLPRSFILLTLILSSLTGAHLFAAPCEDGFHRILESLSFSRKELVRIREKKGNEFFSSLSKSAKPGTYNREFKGIRYQDPWKLRLPIGAGALGEKHPDFVYVLDDICHYQIEFPAFEEEFVRKYKHPPVESEYREFYKTRFWIFKDGMDHLFRELEAHSPDAVPAIHRSFDRRLEGIYRAIAKLPKTQGLEATKDAIRVVRNQVVGVLGEFYGFMGIPDIRQASVFVSDMPRVTERLNETLRTWKARLAENPASISELEGRFPNLFHSKAYDRFVATHPHATANEKLESVRAWIRSKEIDFVRAKDGHESWLEIKTRRKPFGIEDFTDGSYGKSPVQQMKEDREILEFLGLQNEIGLEYVVTSEMSPEVKAALEAIGVKPLEFHGGPASGTTPMFPEFPRNL